MRAGADQNRKTVHGRIIGHYRPTRASRNGPPKVSKLELSCDNTKQDRRKHERAVIALLFEMFSAFPFFSSALFQKSFEKKNLKKWLEGAGRGIRPPADLWSP